MAATLPMLAASEPTGSGRGNLHLQKTFWDPLSEKLELPYWSRKKGAAVAAATELSMKRLLV